MKSKIARSGYVIYPPHFISIGNKFTGICCEISEEIFSRLGLKLEWSEEVNYDTMLSGLREGKYDLIASGIWATEERAKEVTFSKPIFFQLLSAWAKPELASIVDSPEGLFAADLKVSVINGEISETITKQNFPNLELFYLDKSWQLSDLLNAIVQGKSDLTFTDNFTANRFLEKHPGAIINLDPGNPIRRMPQSIVLPKDAPEFERAINNTIDELIGEGFIAELLHKYQFSSDEYELATTSLEAAV